MRYLYNILWKDHSRAHLLWAFLGTLAGFVPIDFSGASNTVDAAISSVSSGSITAVTPSYAYGAPGTTTASVSIGDPVQLAGR